MYKKLLIDRIKIWFKDDAECKGIDPTDLKALTDYFHHAFVKAVEDKYPVVTEPGPDVLRLRVAIACLSTGEDPVVADFASSTVGQQRAAYTSSRRSYFALRQAVTGVTTSFSRG